jgi:hypothetical protein
MEKTKMINIELLKKDIYVFEAILRDQEENLQYDESDEDGYCFRERWIEVLSNTIEYLKQ